MNEFEYYLLLEVEFPSKPAVVFTGKPDEDELLIKKPVQGINLVEMRFDESYKKPTMVDFHSDGVIELISDKIYNILEPLNIQGIQLLPATFSDQKNGVIYDNYYYLHIYNYITCLDKKKAIFMGDEDLGIILAIEKIVLDTNILSKIPLEKRLIFRMEEDRPTQIFHKSIVDKIMAINPEGLRFIKVEDYNSGSAFD